MKFEDMFRKIVEEKCEDYFLGMVDLSLVDNIAVERYKSLISEYPRAISIGITLPYKISNALMETNNGRYNETNCQLKVITTHLSKFLHNEGYKALSMPKSRINDTTDVSIHKIVANWANLGWIAKNGLLITPEAGSGVNWGTVLTDAPFE